MDRLALLYQERYERLVEEPATGGTKKAMGAPYDAEVLVPPRLSRPGSPNFEGIA